MGETVKRRVRELRTMRVIPAAALALVLAGGLGGCGQLRDALGQTKDAPDEFQVVARAPLSLPPNYDLRPPRPGAPRPQERSTTDAAAERILGRSSRVTTSATGGNAPTAAPTAPVIVNSAGEAKIRQQLGLDQAQGDIRSVVDEETANYVYEARYPIDRLLFWREEPPKGVVLDATKEKQRLQENAALGRSPTDGNTPKIERKRGGIFEGIF